MTACIFIIVRYDNNRNLPTKNSSPRAFQFLLCSITNLNTSTDDNADQQNKSPFLTDPGSKRIGHGKIAENGQIDASRNPMESENTGYICCTRRGRRIMTSRGGPARRGRPAGRSRSVRRGGSVR
ncbi:hypothetical protein BPAE_0098g00030 [Botrytis paeoniae]|uniref:Uncharacterized protein n=1 Tax=Botrytis paeoniae TaxID=278948 RepID=A0A4Z1FIE5_9HELO|nr:hypothetical protein BPAE_0098g00030 [Botrytis paeoniae]